MANSYDDIDYAIDILTDGGLNDNDIHSTTRFSTEGETDDDEVELESETPEAINHIEELALSFLSQLLLALPSPNPSVDFIGERPDKDDSDVPHSSERILTRIELELADRRKTCADGSVGTRLICYPRNSRGASAKPFAQLFRVMDLAHEALMDDMPVTKRDIYYKDVPLFKTQAVVDRLVDDLAATFKLERSDLNVRATSKGLVCGSSLGIHLHSGEVVYANDTEGALIPVGEDISTFSLNNDIAWVMIVEKDAVFQTLCRMRLTDRPELPGRGLMVTGKGYPDVATRQLVKSLSNSLPLSIPILALVDGDAYGIDILSVYKYGSMSMRHEGEKLAAERVEWLGVWASELASLNIDRDALIPITEHDEKKAFAMLRRPQSKMPTKWRKELMHMLHSRRKAEIEILSTVKPTILTQLLKPPTNSSAVGDQTSLIFPVPANDQDDLDTLMTDTFGATDCSTPSPIPAPPPLLRYLISKIASFVASSQAQAQEFS